MSEIKCTEAKDKRENVNTSGQLSSDAFSKDLKFYKIQEEDDGFQRISISVDYSKN